MQPSGKCSAFSSPVDAWRFPTLHSSKYSPLEVEQEVAAWTGCIAGALTIEENRNKLQAAGFSEIAIQDAKSDLNIYKEGGAAACCGPATTSSSCCAPAESVAEENAYHDRMRDLLESFDANDYAASVKIFGLKPGS